MSFGEYIKNLRIKKGLTLRQCCANLGADPSNWSKMERGVTPAPKDQNLLEKWADFFDLSAPMREEFIDLASVSRNEIPPDVANDEKVLAALPAFFRAMRGVDLEGEKLEQFIEDIRKINSP